jgi:hypothetical protein
MLIIMQQVRILLYEEKIMYHMVVTGLLELEEITYPIIDERLQDENKM